MRRRGAVVPPPALLLLLLTPAAGFNLEAAHARVWRGPRDNFGHEVELANSSAATGGHSVFVAAMTTMLTRNGRTFDEEAWFQCPIQGNQTCSPDSNFTQDISAGGSPDIPLRTSWNKNGTRRFKFVLQASGSRKVIVSEGSSEDQEIWSSDVIQPGSSYGMSWCLADLNNDGSDDLVVGEPLYSEKNTERGRVYIHIGQQQVTFNTVKIMGLDFAGARFGSSISCIGDIDLDGFQDIAVGATGETGGGAIYIHRGSPGGLEPLFSQRISAADVDIKGSIRGFGVSISQGIDVDSNHYIDLAVGASESRHAVLLRARPVVHLHASLATSVALVGPDTTALTITYHINFTACHQQPPIGVAVVLHAMPVLCAAASDGFCNATSHGQLFSGTETLSTNSTTSRKVLVTLKRGEILSPAPIEAKLEYKLVEVSEPVADFFKTRPVVNPKDAAEHVLKIKHSLSCGNHTCRTALRLHAELENTSRATLGVRVRVENLGEPAYLVTLLLLAAPRLPVVGEAPQCRRDPAVSTTRLECHLGNLLAGGEQKTLYLKLDAKDVPSTSSLQLNLTVVSAGEDSNLSDNTQLLNVRSRVTDTTAKDERRSSSLSKWIPVVSVVGVFVIFALLAAVFSGRLKQRSLVPWKNKVFYKRVVVSEPDYSIPSELEETVSLESEFYDNVEETDRIPRVRRA